MEYGNRRITCVNKDNISMTFTEREFDPFILCKAAGIYDVQNTVQSTANTIIDGAEYQGSVMKMRNIVLTIMDIDDYSENRDQINVLFKKNSLGTLTVTEFLDDDEEVERSIEYYVESITSTATTNKRVTTVSLLCPDPYFYDPDAHYVYVADLMPCFEWIHEFVEEGEEFGYFNDTHIGFIDNDTADDSIGMIIVLNALGTIVNPKIVKIETQEYIQIGESGNDFTMHYGDVLTIVTIDGKKNVFLNGSSVNHYLTLSSTFFKITRGRNSIGYEAASGVEFFELEFTYRNKYLRA